MFSRALFSLLSVLVLHILATLRIEIKFLCCSPYILNNDDCSKWFGNNERYADAFSFTKTYLIIGQNLLKSR